LQAVAELTQHAYAHAPKIPATASFNLPAGFINAPRSIQHKLLIAISESCKPRVEVQRIQGMWVYVIIE
jgi:hypothetical protein